MLRTILAGLGAVFALILVFLASFLGRVAYDVDRQGPAYEKLAVDITRELSRNWSAADIKAHYPSTVAHQLAGADARQALAALKPLGHLRYADDLTHRTRWTRKSLTSLASPADAAELMAELLRRTVRVTFVAKFDNGLADVTMVFKSEGGAIRLWHLQIDSREHLQTPRSGPVAISRA